MLKNYRNRVPTLANSFSSSKELEVSALNKATTPMPSSLSVRKKAYSHKAASKPQRKRYINSRRKQRLIKKFKVKCSLLALVPTDAFKILLTTMCIRLETEKKTVYGGGPSTCRTARAKNLGEWLCFVTRTASSMLIPFHHPSVS